MRVSEIRALSDQELARELESSLKELLNLRFRHATRQLSNTAQIGVAKKKIARLKTVTWERGKLRTEA
jgi:large subunit ribosomal protein L29